jgi:tetratricopeptide (TPR) repeat protein
MRYALFFALSVVTLTVGTLATFDRISVIGAAAPRVDSLAGPTADTLPTPEVVTPVFPSDTDYAQFAAADSVWREANAREYTVAELRARGDGKRSARELVQDRTFELLKAGQRGRAIAQLEQWVAGHPTDDQSLLDLARLLNEEGRSNDAIGRYRQILALHRRAQ